MREVFILAEVYWIRHKNHTDLFNEGYIGVTKTTAKKRFHRHKQISQSSKKYRKHVHNAIIKYGEDIVCQTIVVCDLDYAYSLEKKLRPHYNIGWNISCGGKQKNKKSGFTEEARMKISETHKGKKKSFLMRKRLSEARKGISIPRKPESTEKQRISMLNRIPWEGKNKNPLFWCKADEVFCLWNSGFSDFKASNESSVGRMTVRMMFRKFKEGWNPLEDSDWLNFKNQVIKREN